MESEELTEASAYLIRFIQIFLRPGIHFLLKLSFTLNYSLSSQDSSKREVVIVVVVVVVVVVAIVAVVIIELAMVVMVITNIVTI